MKTPLTTRLGLLPLLAAVAVAALLNGCGGGASFAGVGSGGSGLASGTVSGFGSVYVDGVKIEDAQASNVAESADGGTTTVALKLGQRVSVAGLAGGAASRITVEPAVVGTVGQLDTAAGELVVLGQRVQVNSDAARGPVTVFGGGALSLADLAVGDTLEVHGSRNAATLVLQASRIEKLTAAAAARVTGPVAGLDNTSFTVGGLLVRYAGAAVQPNASLLANGVVVTAWGTAAGNALSASRVRVAPPALDNAAAGSAVQYGGLVSAYDAGAGSFNLQGVVVLLAGASVTPSAASLSNGAYVRVDGVLQADGRLAASGVAVRQPPATDAAARVRLTGAIGSFLNTASFVVRGVPVDASAINTATACPGTVLASGVFVDVSALQQAGTDVVKAVSLACPGTATLPAFAMQEPRGTATNVVASARSFTLVLQQGGTQAVVWNEQTAFNGVSAAGISGVELVVCGYLNASGVLVAREIRLPGRREADRFDPSNGQGAWQQYDNQFRPGGRRPPDGGGTQPGGGIQPPR